MVHNFDSSKLLFCPTCLGNRRNKSILDFRQIKSRAWTNKSGCSLIIKAYNIIKVLMYQKGALKCELMLLTLFFLL